MDAFSDTIAAIATAPGEGGISIVRISGSRSFEIADRLFRGGSAPSSMSGGNFAHGFICSQSQGENIDEVVLLVYRAPASYTREDVVEIQGHGGRTAARRILGCIIDAGARLAEPGEFTKRAFLNGRLDLIQAEAVADLIAAKSDRAATAAFQQLSGRLSVRATSIYDDLTAVAADLEATLDFSDDELPESRLEDIEKRLSSSESDVSALLDTWHEGHLLREGASVVIAGQPNVGKSTLLNALLGKSRSIVTEVPGTTRDTIEEELVLEGIVLRLTDTAGLRETDCRVEKEGIQRTVDSLAQADFVLYIVDGSQPLDQLDLDRCRAISTNKCIVLLNKSDLGSRLSISDFPGFAAMSCSLKRNEGIDLIRQALVIKLDEYVHGTPHASVSERHRACLAETLTCVQASRIEFAKEHGEGALIAASHLRQGLEQLGIMLGRTYHNDLLQNVFQRFCVGK